MHGLTLAGSSFPRGWVDEPNSRGREVLRERERKRGVEGG